MTPSETLMWTVERDPVLRSTFLNITLLDGRPDASKLRQRIADAVEAFPRMSQRVRTGAAWERPAFVDDASFDLDHHIRRVALPSPGTWRSLLDLAALSLEDAFDPVRPLWQLTVVEGIEGDQAALLVKMHHTVTDGVGGMRLSSSFLDLDRAGEVPVRSPKPRAVAPEHRSRPWDRAARRAQSVARAVDPRHALDQVRGATGTLTSVARQGLVLSPSGSRLWRDKRSMNRRLDTTELDLEAVKGAAKRLSATVNDFFVTGLAGGVAEYHTRKGSPVDHLRASMPVSTRADGSFGGNSFAPARVVVPVGEANLARRIELVHEILGRARGEKILGMADSMAAALVALPPAVLTPLARQQVSTIDLAASNLRGSPIELFVAGSRVMANYPMGPTAGVALNATVMSYCGRLDMGIVTDPAAVDDPELLRSCIDSSFAALLDA
jgi:diacylglycerol O-acyltransferase